MKVVNATNISNLYKPHSFPVFEPRPRAKEHSSARIVCVVMFGIRGLSPPSSPLLLAGLLFTDHIPQHKDPNMPSKSPLQERIFTSTPMPPDSDAIHKQYDQSQHLLTDDKDLLRDDTELFSPLSLTDWLHKASLCGIPHVLAETITHFESRDLINADRHGPHQKRLRKAWREVHAAILPDHMMRWDCCASMWLKSEINTGNFRWQKEFGYVHHVLADCRLFDILHADWNRVMLPVLQRPWITPMVIDDYPVEYRVFVQEGVITGVSNYYPQRPLPYRIDDLNAILSNTLKLIKSVDQQWEGGSRGEIQDAFADLMKGKKAKKRDHRSFTADYMVLPDGDVTFLEGGPAHRLDGGAHPCCFEPGNVKGLALDSEKEPLKMSDFIGNLLATQ